MTAYDASVRVPRPGDAGRPNGWWGMAIFVASESALFGTLVGTYLYLAAQAHHWPPAGVQRPALTAPLLLTALLLVTALPLVHAVRAARAGRRGAAWRALAAATVLQLVYLGWQLHEYLTQIDQFSPRASSYASIYFTLLAVAHLHVLVGVVLNVWLLARIGRGLTRYRVVGLRAIVFYWLAVEVITVVVVAIELSPRL
jgi:heme/copper-type cytochrome/quinol oxidase subunit 3